MNNNNNNNNNNVPWHLTTAVPHLTQKIDNTSIPQNRTDLIEWTSEQIEHGWKILDLELTKGIEGANDEYSMLGIVMERTRRGDIDPAVATEYLASLLDLDA
jgi:hypothetical protein